jgi:nitrous oxide reductase accessory protein NosL
MHRRTALGALGSLVGAGLSGCLGGSPSQADRQTPTPVDLSGQKLDDEGGMVIGKHGGPNGQIFYANNTPAGHDGPAWFHTLAFGLFPYYFDHERDGWEATAIYVTDYSTGEYTPVERDGRTVMPAPTAAGTFGDATAMTYVMESDVSGGMGPAFVPFSAVADAQSFVDEHGGRTVTFEEITPELVGDYTRG